MVRVFEASIETSPFFYLSHIRRFIVEVLDLGGGNLFEKGENHLFSSFVKRSAEQRPNRQIDRESFCIL